MKYAETRTALATLGVTVTEIARWLKIDPRSVRRYLDGSRPMPASLDLLLTCLLAYPALIPVLRARVAWCELQKQPAIHNHADWLTREAFQGRAVVGKVSLGAG